MVDETTDGTAGQGAASNPQTPGGLPAQAGTSPAPAAAPQNPSGAAVPIASKPAPSNPPEKNMGDDIAKILEEIKLPERREAELSGEKTPHKEVRDIDTLLRDAPIAAPGAPAAETGAAATAPQEDSSVRSLHTLKQDLQHVVQEQKISVVRAVALEEDRRASHAEVEPLSPSRGSSSGGKNIVFAASLLLFLGAAAFGGVYYVMMDRTGALPDPVSDSLVFAERSVSLDIEGQSAAQIKSLLQSARTAPAASIGSITRIVPIKKGDAGARPATLPEFFSAIGARPPDQLVRALSSDFFFGLHTIDKNAPLLVIPVASYDNAFAGMLAWEDRINGELAPVYAGVPMLVPGADGIPQKRVFIDDVMRNYDVRQLKDDAGAIVLYYAFPTRNLLIIAESPYTFTELLARLQAQRNL